MTRTSKAAIGTMFMLALSFGGSVIHAERRGDAQQGQPQGQGQQGAAKPPVVSVSLRKFVFTLAIGDVQAGAGSTFTPAAARALADLKDFLPYKRYTLLDTVYKIGLSGPVVQMKGVDDGQKYQLSTNGSALADGRRMSVRVQLRVLDTEQPTFLIDTGFELDLGETVVVGTSRLDGNRALLLLVTSVP